jgi:MFS family permease
MSLYGLSFTAGVALGPAVGGALLATSPDAVWWGGALVLAVTGAGLLRLGDRIPDPLVQAQHRPSPAVNTADMDPAREVVHAARAAGQDDQPQGPRRNN